MILIIYLEICQFNLNNNLKIIINSCIMFKYLFKKRNIFKTIPLKTIPLKTIKIEKIQYEITIVLK